MDSRVAPGTGRFAGQSVLVFGGSGGIGRAVATGFAREGARVVVTGRDVDRLAETTRQAEEASGSAVFVRADVTDPGEIEFAVKEAIRLNGRIDVAFNNAGVLVTGQVGDLDRDAWDLAVATNLTGVWAAMKHEITHMRQQGGGVIVNTASNVGAHVRFPGFGAYAATKAAVSVLTKTAALEYISDGIRINSISPGPVDTGMSYLPGESRAERDARYAQLVPAGRVASIEEITAAVLWLASPASGFTVGHDLVLDGGASA